MVDRSLLSDALERAPDVKAASEVLVDSLARIDGLLPSIWLERAGRLRCQAVRGYWQVRDGLLPSSGLIGRTFRTGEPAIELDVRATSDYLEAAPDVVSELCVPIRLGTRIVGCLNVESASRPTPELADELVWCAEAYATCLARIGGPPGSSPAERLVVHAVRLAGLIDPREIERQVIEAACDVSGMESALLLVRDPVLGGWIATSYSGLLGSALATDDDHGVWAVIEGFIQGGTSCYTVDPRNDAPHGSPALRAAGAKALVALPIGAPDPPRAMLVVADPSPVMPTTEEVELLELLAAQAATCLRTVDAVAELRQQASTDPLTGLGHHASFHEALADARAAGSAVAVLLADIDGFKAINDTKGHQTGDRVLREIASALSAGLRRGDALFRVGGDEFAALISVAGAEEAMEAGRRLRAAAAATGTVTVSIGIAIPRVSESDASVLSRADRALYSVKQSGRDGVAIDA
jgi:diguanylate cyclase (GGDEF)-like protein